MQVGNYVYENFEKVAPKGAEPSKGKAVPLRYSDGSFRSVGPPQPQTGALAPGPAPALPAAKLASQASSAPALPPSAGAALAKAPAPIEASQAG